MRLVHPDDCLSHLDNRCSECGGVYCHQVFVRWTDATKLKHTRFYSFLPHWKYRSHTHTREAGKQTNCYILEPVLHREETNWTRTYSTCKHTLNVPIKSALHRKLLVDYGEVTHRIVSFNAHVFSRGQTKRKCWLAKRGDSAATPVGFNTVRTTDGCDAGLVWMSGRDRTKV